MKIKHLIPLSAAALLSVSAAFAQDPDPNVAYGYIVRQAEFKATDLYGMSRFNANMGTARSAAMSGAFASLGADLSSMNINPAGLGMYRTSEFGMTVSFMSTDTKNKVPGASTTNGSRANFGLNNVGVALNVFEGSGALTSFTFGINYNKLADYNYRSRVDIANSSATILDMFAPMVQVYAADMGHDALEGANPWYEPEDGGAFLEEWGAVLAHKTKLVQREIGTDKYNAPGVAGDAGISNYLNTVSKGSAGEYTFSGGWNFSNKFYFGFSLGIMDYYNVRDISYKENYTDNIPTGDRTASNMNYYQQLKTSGEGYNFKLGMIFRPTPELRIGLAVHSPSIVTLRTTYNSEMQVNYANSNSERAWTPTDASFTEKFYTPTRLLGGLSYTFSDRAIIAFDYEHAFYSGIRMRGSQADELRYDGKTTVKEWYKERVKDELRGSHAFRLGGEVRPADNLFVRAGGSYTIEGLSKGHLDGNRIFDVPVEKSSMTLSAGLGYSFAPGLSFDLTYVYYSAQYTKYDLYYYRKEGDRDYFVSDVKMDRNCHNVMLSLNYKF